MTTIEKLEARIQTLEDIQSIAQLKYKYLRTSISRIGQPLKNVLLAIYKPIMKMACTVLWALMRS